MRVERIGNATLYCADCADVLPGLPAVGAVITDPPYGLGHPCNFSERKRGAKAGRRYKGGRPIWARPSNIDWPDVAGDDRPFDPAPLLDIGEARVLWGANWYADRLPASGGWLVWDKERPDTLDQATCELAWTDCVKGVRRFRHLWNGMMRASEREENYHPTQKPVALFSWVLALPWVPKGAIFDPYMGAGPCGVAAMRAGREYIGVELSADYFEVACQRIDHAQRQLRLFA